MTYYFLADIRLWYDHDKLIIFSWLDRVSVKILNKKIALALYVVMNLPESEAEEYLLKLGYMKNTRYNMINKYASYLTTEKTSISLDLSRINLIEDKKLENLEYRVAYPLHVQWIATYKCRHNCIYCGVNRLDINDKEDRIPYEVIKKRLFEAYENGVRVFSIHGGDSLLEYDECIFEVIKQLKSYGCDIIVSTKSKINDRLLKNIKESGLDQIQLSIDTDDELLEQKIYRGRIDQYQNIIDSTKKLNGIGVKVTINIIIMNINCSNIPSLVKTLIDKTNVQSINLSWYVRTINNPKHLEVSEKEKYGLINDMNNLLNDINVKNKVSFNAFGDEIYSFKNKPLCANGRFKFMIFPDGSSGICDFINKDNRFIINNLKNSSIYEIWNSKEYKEIVFGKDENFNNTRCKECSYFKECRKKGICYSKMLLNNHGNYGPDFQCEECGKIDNA